VDSTRIDELAISKIVIHADQVDAGLDIYIKALQLDAEHLQQLARSVRRKLDFILLPLVSFPASLLRQSSILTPSPDVCCVHRGFHGKGDIEFL
jgi:hypothetical protein